jgi:hypothetical protein
LTENAPSKKMKTSYMSLIKCFIFPSGTKIISRRIWLPD